MKINNIVATVKLMAPLDITYLNNNIPGTIKDAKVQWLKYYIPGKKSYVAFYQSGKFLVTGKSFEQIDENVKYVLSKLEEVGISIKGWKLEIHNIVISDRISFPYTLEKLMVNLNPKKASFEPEQFPALVYKDWGVTFLLFSNGKIILTGVKSIDYAKSVLQKLKDLLRNIA